MSFLSKDFLPCSPSAAETRVQQAFVGGAGAAIIIVLPSGRQKEKECGKERKQGG